MQIGLFLVSLAKVKSN